MNIHIDYAGMYLIVLGVGAVLAIVWRLGCAFGQKHSGYNTSQRGQNDRHP